MAQRTTGVRRQWSAACGAILLVLTFVLGAVAPGVVRAQATPIPPREPLSRYQIDAALDPGIGAINAEMTLDWVNATGEAQRSVYFRLYPNAAYYGNGALTVLDATVDGAPVTAALAADPTVLKVPLPAEVAPGKRAAIDLRFQTAVPASPPEALGIFQVDGRGVWSLANWYPIVAGFEPGQGWYLDPPTVFGDPTFSDMATYAVRFTTPQGYTVFGSGAESSRVQADGMLLTTFDAPLAREFALTALPGEAGGAVASAFVRVDGVTLSLVLPADMMIPGLQDLLLDTAAAAVPVYEGWFGALPDRDVQITTVDLASASGVSFAGTIWLDLGMIVADGQLSEFEQIALRFTIIHEIGHQWIGNVVSANTNDHQFMSEGLVNMLSVAVIDRIDGPAAAERYLRADVGGAYQALLRDGRDGVADEPISPELNGVLHALFVYGKAAIGFEAIRQEIGNDAFFAAMTDYGNAFRYGIVTPDDLRGALEASSGKDLDPLWAFWFERADATTADVDAILDNYAATAGA